MNFTIIPQSWAPILQGVMRIVTGLLLLEHGTAKILGFPDLSAMKPMLGGLWVPNGPNRTDRRCADNRRLPDPSGGLRPLGLLRGGLFHRAHADGVLPRPQPWRVGGAVLLRISLFRLRRSRRLGGRQGLTSFAGRIFNPISGELFGASRCPRGERFPRTFFASQDRIPQHGKRAEVPEPRSAGSRDARPTARTGRLIQNLRPVIIRLGAARRSAQLP